MNIILYTILAYNTRRSHQIACENLATLIRICENRFGYTQCVNGYEPNWIIMAQRII